MPCPMSEPAGRAISSNLVVRKRKQEQQAHDSRISNQKSTHTCVLGALVHARSPSRSHLGLMDGHRGATEQCMHHFALLGLW